MQRLVGFLIFLALFLVVVGSAHYYVWTRLVRDVELPPSQHRAATLAIQVMFGTLVATLVLGRQIPPSVSRYVLMPGYIWLGSIFFATWLLGALDLSRWLLFAGRKLFSGAPLDPERRLALQRLLGFSAAAMTVSLAGYSIWRARAGIRVKVVEIPLAKLPPELDGTIIVQITDVHIGPTIGREFISDVVTRINELGADLVAITGDLVDGDVQNLAHAAEPLGQILSKHGTFFVTGNHEYYSGVHEWCAKLTEMGIRVLRNERVVIGTDKASFDLAGVDDYTAAQFGEGHGSDFEQALGGRDPNRELVLLAHQPRSITEAQARGVGLQLSGHTHGGQLWPFNFLVKLQQPVVAGLVKIGETFLYVSRGTGYWGPPMRLGAPAEITKIVLRSTQPEAGLG